MNLKDLIFGGGVKSGGDGGTYRDSIQAWLPIKNIIGGVVITKDGRFVKILELLPVNIYLKSPILMQVHQKFLFVRCIRRIRNVQTYLQKKIVILEK